MKDKLFLILNKDNKYLPRDNWGVWTPSFKSAKKYVSRTQAFKKLEQLYKRNPDKEYLLETVEVTPIERFSYTDLMRNRKTKIIKERIERKINPIK